VQWGWFGIPGLRVGTGGILGLSWCYRVHTLDIAGHRKLMVGGVKREHVSSVYMRDEVVGGWRPDAEIGGARILTP